MPKVDLKLYSTSTSDGSKITSSVPYVNPDATNDALKTFAQKLNSFTTNSYASADKVETTNLDTAPAATKRNMQIRKESSTRYIVSINCEMDETFTQQQRPYARYTKQSTSGSNFAGDGFLTQTTSEEDTIANFLLDIQEGYKMIGNYAIGIVAKDGFDSDFIYGDSSTIPE